MGNPTSIKLKLREVSGRSKSGYPPVNPSNRWRIAPAYQLFRTDTLRQITHKSESGSSAFWRWASTKHNNTYRFAWQGGQPPFRFTVFRAGVIVEEITWARTQSTINPLMYDHQYPEHGYEFNWQPETSENGTTVNFKVLVESQDGQVLLITVPISVDNSRFKYFAPSPVGNNANAGTFEAPYETFGYGYASVANAQNYIYYYKAGTYFVNNGAAINDAGFNSTHCKSHIGLESGVIFNMSQGHFSQGTSDIYVSNVKLTGGRPDRNNVRQMDLDLRCTRLHLHKVIFDTTYPGLQTTGDNPSGIMLWDITNPNYHEDIAITDCILTSTSVSQMAVLFQTKNFVIEGCSSNSPVITGSNGAQILHLKDGTLNGTVRHCELIGSTVDGHLNVASQDWAACGNVDIHFCKIVNTKVTAGAVSRWNIQVDVAPREKPINYYVQRCSLDALNSYPFHFENFTGLGYPVNHSALLWKSSLALLDGRNLGGGTAVGTSSAKVADIDNLSVDNLGVRGSVISSTLVN